MRPVFTSVLLLVAACTMQAAHAAAPEAASASAEQRMIRAIYSEALAHGEAYDHLRELVGKHPARLGGSASLAGAIQWAKARAEGVKPDRVYLQDVLVPHWERRSESVWIVDAGGVAVLSASALGGSGSNPDGVMAAVIEVGSIEELESTAREAIEGKIVFFNGAMDPTLVRPGAAYGAAGGQRMRGPALASKLGAVGAIVRSLTFSNDDVPHTGMTRFPAGVSPIPALALSTMASDRLSGRISEAKRSGGAVRVGIKVDARQLPDAPSHNVIAEITGTEFPDQVIVVGAHTDCWDNSPGAHDDGAGMVQAIEVLRIFRALGIKPRHTIRCVLFVNEENGLAGAKAYAAAAANGKEKHLFAIETDSGGFEPRGFSFLSAEGDPARRAAEKWAPLLRPYGVVEWRNGHAGTDVTPLVAQGAVCADLSTDSQRYFDLHHTAIDTFDKVNPRELHLGAAALTSLLWLVDQQGL